MYYSNRNPEQLIEAARNRIAKGQLYGFDMRSSQELCFADATQLIERAVQTADAISDSHDDIERYESEV